MQPIAPCLWFDSQAEEAAAFYVWVFPYPHMARTTRYPEGAPRPPGAA